MLAGLLISVFVGLLLMGRNFLFQKVDEAVIATNDVPTLLKRARSLYGMAKFNQSLDAYGKILTLEPYHIRANSAVTKMLMQKAKTKEEGLKIIDLYEPIYSYYYSNDFEKYNTCSSEDQQVLSAMMYRYGFLLSQVSHTEEANTIKRIALMNQDFVTKSSEFINALSY